MRSLSAALILLCAAPVVATPTRLVLDYDLHVGPIRLLALRATVDLDAARYLTATEMRTVGLVGALFPWRAQAHSTGVQAPGGLQPEQHRSEGTYRGQRRVVEIEYASHGGVSARIEPPPESDWRDAVPQALQDGTVDPLSAGLSVMSRNCAGTVAVFDGRRRYDLHLTDLGSGELDASMQPLFTGPARRCRAVVEPLAGFWKVQPRQSESPTRLDFWVATPLAGAPPVPVYLELSGSRGTLRIQLTDIGTPTS